MAHETQPQMSDEEMEERKKESAELLGGQEEMERLQRESEELAAAAAEKEANGVDDAAEQAGGKVTTQEDAEAGVLSQAQRQAAEAFEMEVKEEMAIFSEAELLVELNELAERSLPLFSKRDRGEKLDKLEQEQLDAFLKMAPLLRMALARKAEARGAGSKGEEDDRETYEKYTLENLQEEIRDTKSELKRITEKIDKLTRDKLDLQVKLYTSASNDWGKMKKIKEQIASLQITRADRRRTLDVLEEIEEKKRGSKS